MDELKRISYLVLPLSYIEFSQEEACLFKLLFIDDMDLNMKRAGDFYREIGNEERAKAFSEAVGVELESAKKMVMNMVSAFVNQEGAEMSGK